MSTDSATLGPRPPWRTAMRRLFRPFLILLALIFLVEAWLWSHLAPIVAWIVDHIPLRRIKVWAAAAIERLPPYATLAVFVVPVILLLPLKFLGLWMLAHGQWLGALAVLGLAKVVSLGVTAFIFDLTREKLLQLAWFRQLYDWVLWLLEQRARARRSDQAPHQGLAAHLLAEARLAHAAAPPASAPDHARPARRMIAALPAEINSVPGARMRGAGREQVLDPVPRVVRHMRGEQAESHEAKPDDGEPQRCIDQRHRAGDDGG